MAEVLALWLYTFSGCSSSSVERLTTLSAQYTARRGQDHFDLSHDKSVNKMGKLHAVFDVLIVFNKSSDTFIYSGVPSSFI